MASINGSGVLIGTAADDDITGDGLLSGLDGNDILEAQGTDDRLYGGRGDDELRLVGLGSPTAYGGDGDDTFVVSLTSITPAGTVIDGGLGNDLLRFTEGDPFDIAVSSSAGVVIDLQEPWRNGRDATGLVVTGVESVQGTHGKDFISGNQSDNTFYFTRGIDLYSGKDGFDTYYVGSNLIGPSGIPAPTGIELAFGARATELALSLNIAVGGPEEDFGIAVMQTWSDLNGDFVVTFDEVTTKADILLGIEQFVGTSASDVLTGSIRSDVIAGYGGEDTINGRDDFDFVSYDTDFTSTGVKVDLVQGLSWLIEFDLSLTTKDTLTSIEGAIGGDWNDLMKGNIQANIFYGRSGDDGLDGGEGNDTLWGEDGSDVLIGGEGDDVLIGGANGVDEFGNQMGDVLDGGGGIDTASYRDAETSVAVDLLRGEGLVPEIEYVTYPGSDSVGDLLYDVENVVGSSYDDVIRGNDGNNVIEGRLGNDLLLGCDGDDRIYGETDPNSIVALNLKKETVTCHCDPDVLPSSSVPEITRNDTIEGGCGDDQLYGAQGNDRLKGDEDNDRLFGGDGTDQLYGGDGNDYMDGGKNTDFLDGGLGNDTLRGGKGFDFLFGSDGIDTADYVTSSEGVVVNLTQFWLNSGGDASTDYLEELVDTLIQGSDPATVFGSSLFIAVLSSLGISDKNGSSLRIPDVTLSIENVNGSAFADNITGNGVDNVINGGAGDDVIAGGGGNDTLGGGAGADSLSGDEGNDRFLGGEGADRYDGGLGAADIVDYFGSSSGVTVALDGGFAGTGDGAGDTFFSIERVRGTALADNIRGDGAANLLQGDAGSDALNGAGGADVLRGGGGTDLLTGGAGADTFQYTALTDIGDTIQDFSIADDTFQFSRSAFGGAPAGILNAAAFQTSLDNLARSEGIRFIFETDSNVLWYDPDGNASQAAVAVATMQVGVGVLTNADIVFI